MAMQGISPVEIAKYSAIIIIPFSLKILLAPFMEKFVYLPMGRRRPWLLFGQYGIFCSFIALATINDPMHHIDQLTWVVLCMHICIMFQDIATDSLVIDIVPLEQQGKANSFMWGSKVVGTSTSLFVGSMLINQFGLSVTAISMSACIIAIMFIPISLRERLGEKLLPWLPGNTSPESKLLTVDSWAKLFNSFWQAIKLRNLLLLLVSVFITMTTIHYMRTLMPIFVIQELKWDNVNYSKVYSTCNLTGGIIGMLVGAVIIQRFGIVKLIQGGLVALGSIILILSCTSSMWTNHLYITGFIALFCTLLTLINIGVLALAMHLCWKRISALQFTFCMTIFNAGLATGAALFGRLKPIYPWPTLLLFCCISLLLAMIIYALIKSGRHREQVDQLETKYLSLLNAEGKLLNETDAG